jgi:hypothetical protein
MALTDTIDAGYQHTTPDLLEWRLDTNLQLVNPLLRVVMESPSETPEVEDSSNSSRQGWSWL